MRSPIRTRLLMGLAGIAMLAAARPAFPDHCVSYHATNLNILIDYSASMARPAWKHDGAQRFALAVIDTLATTGRLRALGGIGFPTLPAPPGFNLIVSSENIPVVRDRIANTRASQLSGATTPLYLAIDIGAGHLAAMTGPERKLMVVVTDGRDSGPTTFETAANALANAGATTFLVFVGAAGSPGEAPLRDLAAEANRRSASRGTGSNTQFRLASTPTALELADTVLAASCRNYAPIVRMDAVPASLRLGRDGFDVRFDATRTTDRETAFGSLDFAWALTRPDGTPGGTHSARGTAGASFTSAFTEADFGTWGVALEVADGDGGRHRPTGTFEILNSPPVLDLFGGGTVDVGETISFGQNTTADADGGTIDIRWEVTGGPAGGSFPVGHVWHQPTVSFPSTAADVTLASVGGRLRDQWVFRVTLTDNEMATVSGDVFVEVVNAVPALPITASEVVRVGESLTLGDASLADPDGGPLVISWDLIQAPDADADGASYSAGRDVASTATFEMPTTPRDAGTWIIELEVTDDEGESVSGRTSVLVDAPPVVDISAPATIRSESDPLVLDGSASRDPDTPCSAPDFCHTNIEGPVTDISPGITEWSWSVVDLPIQDRSRAPYGEADEVFGEPGHGHTLSLPAGVLSPGEWTFQLAATDGEGNDKAREALVVVSDESSKPAALVSPPARHVLDALGRAQSAVFVDGSASHDPDEPDSPAAGAGITDYAWEVVSGPSCAAVVPPRGPGAAVWRVFDTGTVVPPDCHGSWQVRLSVTDNDPVPRVNAADTRFSIGTCGQPICIDHPTGSFPVLVEQSARTDVPIYYHLDTAVFGDTSAFPYGLVTRLDIHHLSDPVTPVYTAFDTNVAGSVGANASVFHWTGHHGAFAPRRGTYSVSISVLDHGSGTPLYTATEPNAIAIAGPDPVFDCGNLWAGGFPDARYGGAFPCVEYEPLLRPLTVGDIRMFYPPGWLEADPRNERLLEWAYDAAADAGNVLSGLRPLPPMAIFFSTLPGELDGHPAGEAYIAHFGAGERCPIGLYPDANAYTEPWLRFVVAHEVAHCLQAINFPTYQEWWGQGTAEYFANLVYPASNREHHWFSAAADPVYVYRTDLPIHGQSYATVGFFQSLANHPDFGLPGILSLMSDLARPGADPARVLSGTRRMDDAFHRFGQQAVAWQMWEFVEDVTHAFEHGILDDGGGYYGPDIPSETAIMAGVGSLRVAEIGSAPVTVGEVRVSVRPFTVRRVRLFLDAGGIYRVRLTSDDPGARTSWLSYYGVDPARWQDLPDPIVTPCSGPDRGLWELTYTSTSADLANATLTIRVDSEANPACP